MLTAVKAATGTVVRDGVGRGARRGSRPTCVLDKPVRPEQIKAAGAKRLLIARREPVTPVIASRRSTRAPIPARMLTCDAASTAPTLRRDDQGALPGVLHLRARVPGQGDPHRGGPGRGHGRALHRLRQLRARVQPEGQAASAAIGAAGGGAAGGRRTRRGAASPRASRRSSPSATTAQLVGMLRALGLRLRQRGRLRGRPGGRAATASCSPQTTAGATSPPPARPSSPSSSATTRTWCRAWRRSSRRWWRRPGRCGGFTARTLRMVFIGPCIAKKGEAASTAVAGEIDAVLTFAELREMLAEARHRRPTRSSRRDFDPPHGGLGRALPDQPRHAPGGRHRRGPADRRGGGRRRAHAASSRRSRSSSRATSTRGCWRCSAATAASWGRDDAPGAALQPPRARAAATSASAAGRSTRRRGGGDIDALRRPRPEPRLRGRRPADRADRRRARSARSWPGMGKRAPEDELNCGACGYDTCREHAVAIYKGLAESEMCLPYTIEQLRNDGQGAGRLERAAGQRAGGADAVGEAGQHGAAGGGHRARGQQPARRRADVRAPAAGGVPRRLGDARATSTIIAEQADRCKKIVAGLLHFARQNKVVLQPVDVRELVADVPARAAAARGRHGRASSTTTRRTRSPSSTATRSSRC